MVFILIDLNHEAMTVGPDSVFSNEDHHVIGILFGNEKTTDLGPTLWQFNLLSEVALRIEDGDAPVGRQWVELEQCDNNMSCVGDW